MINVFNQRSKVLIQHVDATLPSPAGLLGATIEKLPGRTTVENRCHNWSQLPGYSPRLNPRMTLQMSFGAPLVLRLLRSKNAAGHIRIARCTMCGKLTGREPSHVIWQLKLYILKLVGSVFEGAQTLTIMPDRNIYICHSRAKSLAGQSFTFACSRMHCIDPKVQPTGDTYFFTQCDSPYNLTGCL